MRSTQRTGTGDGEADLFAGTRSSLIGLLGCVCRGGGSGRPGVAPRLLSDTMALSCFSFSSLTQSLFCISNCMALTRRSCTARGMTFERGAAGWTGYSSGAGEVPLTHSFSHLYWVSSTTPFMRCSMRLLSHCSLCSLCSLVSSSCCRQRLSSS